jgi:glycosyltransferase involved in cell wall biosynthesis
MKKRFVTIFPVAENVHLVKDVGQVGNFMSIIGGYESTLVCYKNSEAYPNLETETKNLKLEFLEPCGRKLFMEKAILNYIQENARKINVIHFFHLTKETIYYALYFKKCNPKGKVYVKMDVYNEMLEEGMSYSKKRLFNWFHKRKEEQFFKKVTAISAENPTSVALLMEKFPLLKDKAFLLTNGVNDSFLGKSFPQLKSFSEKENIILSVGRIGAKDKNHEMLLDSFIQSKTADWQLVLVGPVENDFDLIVKQAIKEDPHLERKIILTGSIENRVELYQYYNKAKIFCLTSPFESFGIAFVEAMYFGNYIIGTKGMSSFKYISNNLELGSMVEADDTQGLTLEIDKLTSNPTLIESNCPKAKEQVKEKFYWSEIIKELERGLRQ